MHAAKMISLVQQLFGDTSESQVTEEFILDMLNAGQREVGRQTKVLLRRSETSAAAEIDGYAFSEDFIQIESVRHDGKELERIDPAVLDSWNITRSLDDGGTPTNYYVKGRTIWLYPTPDASGSGNLDIWYIKKPEDLTNSEDSVSELPETMHMDVVLYALAKCKQLDEEFEQAATVQAELQNNLIESRAEAFSTGAQSYSSVRLLPGDF